MFEGIMTNLKTNSKKVSESLNFENLRSHGTRFSENLDIIKSKTSRFSETILTTLKSTRVPPYLSSRYESNENISKSLGQYNTKDSGGRRELKWPVLVDNNMKWITRLPKTKSEEEEDIVDRFIRVISVDEDNESSLKRRNDREEIRRRLAMGSDADEYYGGERPGRKPSLQARLQSGMNLQICFMNETVSDTESPSSDTETISSPSKSVSPLSQSYSATSTKVSTPPPQIVTPSLVPPVTRPSPSSLTLPLRQEQPLDQPMTEADFFARQARLQAEARLALAQAKEMAHMQMEVERQRQKKSPITEMVRSSLEKVGIPFPDDRRRVSRQILTEMNLAQLQVIVNDLHTQIEVLNENLVKFLMDRDDLHMEQDSMLVDIEDLTRYLKIQWKLKLGKILGKLKLGKIQSKLKLEKIQGKFKTGEDSRETKTGEDSRETKTGEDSRETKTGEDSRETKTGEDSRETKTGEDSSDTKTGEDSRETKTGEDSRETNWGAKEQSVKEDVHSIGQNNNHLIASSKPKINRITSLVKK
uniref:Schwannomin interacting protein 1 C-terminal domain-containing protein n=1 Tax=Timema tahoe TaxID=61484 RepID=A0A7R9I8R3_9NEOP|nr:unnamed protein product [Timema tahoe]